MNPPAAGPPRRPGPRVPRAPRDPGATGPRRRLTNVLARHAARVRSGEALLRSCGRALWVTVVAALLALPVAAAWGIGTAKVTDYLGPHQVRFATDYRGEVEINLGPLGDAYLRSPVAPIGVSIAVGGAGEAGASFRSLFSEQTLAAYTALYTDPQEAVRGVVERLERDALIRTAGAEVVLVLGFGLWTLRRHLLSPWVVSRVTRRRTAAVYVTAGALLVGSILVPSQPDGPRIPVDVELRDVASTVTVDSPLLADLVDRGISGVQLLAEREQDAVRAYVGTAAESLSRQLASLPKPRPGEEMVIGFSDLHCNQAMTELITRLVAVSKPDLVLDSGDDTVNGTAAERGCITREVAIAGGRPFVDATGNHDSDVTEAQLKAAGAVVLNGATERVGDWTVLGDDDPELQIPFSVDRTRDRAETEAEMGTRLLELARTRPTEVILVHQPRAAAPIMADPAPPVRLVLWGHMHAQLGPTVITHPDGAWTVGMQEGTAGGVKEPTITSVSTPFSPPRARADVYFYFRDRETGLVTGVQPVHFEVDGSVVIDRRIVTGNLATLPTATRERLTASTSASPSASPS